MVVVLAIQTSKTCGSKKRIDATRLQDKAAKPHRAALTASPHFPARTQKRMLSSQSRPLTDRPIRFTALSTKVCHRHSLNSWKSINITFFPMPYDTASMNTMHDMTV